MSILFDSDVIIDFLNNQKNAVELFKKFTEIDLFISIISWLEVVYGIKKSKSLLSKLNQFQMFIKNFNIKVLPIEEKIAEKFIEIKIDLENQKTPLADFDLLIGATAIVFNLTVATRNQKHFSRIKNLKIYR